MLMALRTSCCSIGCSVSQIRSRCGTFSAHVCGEYSARPGWLASSPAACRPASRLADRGPDRLEFPVGYGPRCGFPLGRGLLALGDLGGGLGGDQGLGLLLVRAAALDALPCLLGLLCLRGVLARTVLGAALGTQSPGRLVLGVLDGGPGVLDGGRGPGDVLPDPRHVGGLVDRGERAEVLGLPLVLTRGRALQLRPSRFVVLRVPGRLDGDGLRLGPGQHPGSPSAQGRDWPSVSSGRENPAALIVPRGMGTGAAEVS